LENGEKRWPPPPMKAAPAAAAPAPKPVAAPAPAPVSARTSQASARSSGHHGPPARAPSKASGVILSMLGLVAAAVWIWLRLARPDAMGSAETTELIQRFTVFVMAVFIGFQVVWNVTPAL